MRGIASGLAMMAEVSLPGANYRRRRDSLPQEEQLERIAKAQLKRERKQKLKGKQNETKN